MKYGLITTITAITLSALGCVDQKKPTNALKTGGATAVPPRPFDNYDTVLYMTMINNPWFIVQDRLSKDGPEAITANLKEGISPLPYDMMRAGSNDRALPGIKAGSRLMVVYQKSLDELLRRGNISAKDVYMGYKFEGVDAKEIKLHRDRSTRFFAYLDISEHAVGNLEFWFRIDSNAGTEHYDSNVDKNYHVQILSKPSAKINFINPNFAGWDPKFEGTLKAGHTVEIKYEALRMDAIGAKCTHYRGANICASAELFIKAYAGDQMIQHVSLQGMRSKGASDERVDPRAYYKLPLKATRIEMWFRHYVYSGPYIYDSGPNSKNYHFKIN